ncbi:MAG: AtpZ/AtpI family protein [Acidimicrobiia bacterium]
MEQRDRKSQARADVPSRRTLRSLISRQAASAAAAAGVTPEHQPTERGELYRNFGDGFTRAFELAVTPLIFGAAGYWLDGRVGIRPVLTILLTVLALVALLLRTWYGYVYRMQKLEEAGPWAVRRPIERAESTV